MDTSELSPKNHTEGRVVFFDIWRGFVIVSMVLFHFVYDLVYLSDMHLSWFTSPFIDIWRASISWSFLFIAGSMCAFSKNALRRACLYGALAALIFLITSLVRVDVPISFGIIFLHGRLYVTGGCSSKVSHYPTRIYSGSRLLLYIPFYVAPSFWNDRNWPSQYTNPANFIYL